MVDGLSFIISFILAFPIHEIIIRGNRHIDLVPYVSEADGRKVSVRTCLPVEIHRLDE